MGFTIFKTSIGTWRVFDERREYSLGGIFDTKLQAMLWMVRKGLIKDQVTWDRHC